MKLFTIIRSNDWWEYKLIPILVMPYFIILRSNLDFQKAILLLSFILFSLAIGAIFVAILNNITDIKEDELAGKANKMSEYGNFTHFILLLFPSLIIITVCWFLKENLTVMYLCLLSCISFILYSVPPFRLKKRGVAGILADASGSQLFPTLSTMIYISAQTNYKITVLKVSLVAIWSLCFGLRGILWHQFQDLENDLKSGLYTIVQNMSTTTTKIVGLTIIVIELGAVIGILTVFGNYYFYSSLIVYFLYLLLYQRKTNVQIIILKHTQQHFCIFMSEYYQVILPIFLLVIVSFEKPMFIFLLLIHILFFPKRLHTMLKNTYLWFSSIIINKFIKFRHQLIK